MLELTTLQYLVIFNHTLILELNYVFSSFFLLEKLCMQGPYVQKLRMHFWNWANFFSKIVVNNFVNITEPMSKLLNKLLTNIC